MLIANTPDSLHPGLYLPYAQFKAVCIVHNETTTGVTSDIAAMRAAMDAANHPALLLVDGVSSIGRCRLEGQECTHKCTWTQRVTDTHKCTAAQKAKQTH